jgi:putative ABC transport system permease protein
VKLVRWLFDALGAVAGTLVLGCVRAAALLLMPFRLGRLLRTVSIPRLEEHRLRTSLTVVGIALGVAVLIAVVIINRSILGSMTSTLDDIAGKADLQVSASGRGSGFAESVLETIMALPEVYKATPILQQTAILRDPRAPGERMLLLGVDLLGRDDEYFRAYASDEITAIKEDPLIFLNSPYNIIISRSLADKLGCKLHDKLPLATPDGLKQFDIWGFIENEGVGRAFGGSVAVMYYQAMQSAFNRGQNIDRVDLAVHPGADAAAVTARLSKSLGSGFHVERPDRKNDRVAKMLTSLRTGLNMGSMIALMVGMFLIYNTMSINVVQRKKEIGILRALGITRSGVARLVTLEGFLLGLVGSALGVLLGLVMARGALAAVSRSVNEMWTQIGATELTVDGALLAGGFGLGVLATTIASAIPARRAARPHPTETLRGSALMTLVAPRAALTRLDLLALGLFVLSYFLLRLPPVEGVPAGAMASIAALLLGGALLMRRVVQLVRWALHPIARRWFGLEAELANDNLPRDLGRSAATSGALMVGVAMVMSFAVFSGSLMTSMSEWIDRSLPADLFVTSASRFAGVKNAPMSPTLREALSAIPGVEFVERQRITDIDFHDVPIKLLSSDSAAYDQRAPATLLEGTHEGVVQSLARGGVLVSENFARRFDVHLGDQIELGARDGTRKFVVAGVAVDYTSDQGTLVMERSYFVEYWGDDQVDTFKVYLRPGADVEPVRRAINRDYGEKFDLFVLTNREFKTQALGLLDQVFDVMRVLELVALVIAVLGVVNALFANVLDRVRELGTLRAVGMLRRQARKMIIVEGVLLGLCGVCGGLLVGSATGWVLLTHVNMVQTGWHFPYRPAWFSVLETALLVIAISGVAASYPARKAAALRIPDALAYE